MKIQKQKFLVTMLLILQSSPQISKIAPYREFIRGYIPVSIQDAIRVQCDDIVFEVADAYSATLPPICNLDMPNQNLQ